MGRCPDYLNVDDFDRLAATYGVTLSDDAAGALGEACELIAGLVINDVRSAGRTTNVAPNHVLDAIRRLGFRVIEADEPGSLKSIRTLEPEIGERTSL